MKRWISGITTIAWLEPQDDLSCTAMRGCNTGADDYTILHLSFNMIISFLRRSISANLLTVSSSFTDEQRRKDPRNTIEGGVSTCLRVALVRSPANGSEGSGNDVDVRRDGQDTDDCSGPTRGKRYRCKSWGAGDDTNASLELRSRTRF